MVIYMYIEPQGRGRQPPGVKFFSININFLSICILPTSFLHLIPFYYFFPFECISELSFPCRKIGQGHPRVMIYTNFVELHCLLLHAKFQNHRPSGSGEGRFSKVFAIYSHGGHLGHVTLSIYALPNDAPHKVWL